MNSNETNPCKARGCHAKCCYSNTLYLPAKERRHFFPNATSVIIDNFNQNIEGITEYAAFAGYEGTVAMEYFRFLFWCYYLSDGDCTIHDNPPSPCSNLQIESPECNTIFLSELL